MIPTTWEHHRDHQEHHHHFGWALLIALLLVLLAASALAQSSLYWTLTPENKIQQFVLPAHSAIDLVVAPLANPGAIWLDPESDRMYWNSLGRNQIRRARMDGSEIEDLIRGQLLGIDLDTGAMFLNRSDSLLRASLDGSGLELLSVLENPMFDWANVDAAVDPVGDRVFWCTTEPHGIQKASLDGSDTEVIYEGEAHSLMVDPESAHLYWNTGGTCGQLVRTELDGSGLETVVNGCVAAAAIDTVLSRLFWVEDEEGTAFRQRFCRADLDGSFPQCLFDIYDSDREFDGIAIHPERLMVYWTSDRRIQRSYLSGTDREDLIVSDMFAPRGLAVDPVRGDMYWGSINTIQRSDLFGWFTETVVADVEGWIYDVAIDPMNEFTYWVYWSDSGENRIQRARLDGSEITNVTSFPGSPYSLVLDPDRGSMYFMDRGRIIRADLDGGNQTIVIDRGEHVTFHDIILDPDGEWIYWLANGSSTSPQPDVEEVGRSRLDGTAAEVLYTDTYAWWGSLALDVDSGFLYWSVTREGTVWRIPIGGSHDKEFVASVPGRITSLAFSGAGGATAARHETIPGDAFSLGSYPNPFETSITIRYEIDEVAPVLLAVFDVLGRMVATLVDRTETAGQHAATWTPPSTLPAGLYFATLSAVGQRATIAIMMLGRD